MQQDVSQAVADGVLKPVSELRINEEKDCDEYKLGLLLDTEVPQIFCNAARPTRVDKIKQRAEFSNYLVVPTKFGFRKLVRVLSLVLKFVGKCRRKVPALVDMAETAETEGKFRFSTFHVSPDNVPVSSSPISQTPVSSSKSLCFSVDTDVFCDVESENL